MQKTIIFYVMIFLLVAAIFSSILPYPIFSNYTNLTEENSYDINNYYETEMENQTNQNPQILKNLDWESIDVLLPVNEEFEVIDIKSNQSFFVVRTGGKNHADVETIDEKNSLLLHEIFDEDWKWERRPILLKVNENAYLPASISGYPHGFTHIKNGLNGHLCIHFIGSKTHGTNIVDDYHQKNIKYAINHGKEVIID